MDYLTRIIFGNILFIIGSLTLLWSIKRLIERKNSNKNKKQDH